MIANCAEATGDEYWKNLYKFTDKEWLEIKSCYIDVGKEKNLRIYYTKDNAQRYGWQRRTTMVLMVLDNRMIQASGIKNIKFSSVQRFSPKLNQDTLTIFDEDVNGMIESIFCACYQRNPKLVKKYLRHKYSKTEWARLFRECTLDIRRTAERISENINLYNKILCLKNFTRDWLPEKFWRDIFRLRQEYIADKVYRKQFEKYNITFDVPLPSDVTGKACSKKEINNAKRIFITYSSLLNQKFMQGCGIKRIAFAKEMRHNNKTIIGGIYSRGVLCLDPTFIHLGRTVLYESFLQFARNNPRRNTQWSSIRKIPRNYMSALARESPQHDQAETFAWLLWNPYHTLNSRKDAVGFMKKIDIIFSMDLFSPRAYKILDLKKPVL